MNKMKKNILFRLIESLFITLENVSYSVIQILNYFADFKTYDYLKEVTINHADRVYSDDDIKEIKYVFKRTPWKTINFIGEFRVEKC